MSTFNKFAEMSKITSASNTSFGHLPDKSETNLWLTDAMMISRLIAKVLESSKMTFHYEEKKDLVDLYYTLKTLWKFLRTKNKDSDRQRVQNMDKSFAIIGERIYNFKHSKQESIIPFELFKSMEILEQDIYQTAQDWGFGSVMRERYNAKKALQHDILQ